MINFDRYRNLSTQEDWKSVHALVGADDATKSQSFAIGWSHKNTRKPQPSG